jgi:hypothetical protein
MMCKYYDRCPYAQREEDHAWICESDDRCGFIHYPKGYFAMEDFEKALMNEMILPFYDKVFAIAYKIIRFFGGS